MEVKINIESDRFKDVLENELQAFSKDEMHEILRQAIIKAIDESGVIITKNENLYDGERWKLGSIFEKAIQNINYEELLKPIKEKMVEYIEKNHSRIIENMIWNMITQKLCRDNTFEYTLKMAINKVLEENDRNRQY